MFLEAKRARGLLIGTRNEKQRTLRKSRRICPRPKDDGVRAY